MDPAAVNRAMTWEEYERLPEDIRYEYIDGQVVVSPYCSGPQAWVITRLTVALSAALPDTHVALSHVGWKPDRDEFGPDIMVIPTSAIRQKRFTGIPDLVVEVLSTNRANELVTKMRKYALAGAPRYWVADPPSRSLFTLVLVDGLYQPQTQLDDDNPTAALDTGLGPLDVTQDGLFG